MKTSRTMAVAIHRDEERLRGRCNSRVTEMNNISRIWHQPKSRFRIGDLCRNQFRTRNVAFRMGDQSDPVTEFNECLPELVKRSLSSAIKLRGNGRPSGFQYRDMHRIAGDDK